MGYAEWTDKDWGRLMHLVRETPGVTLNDEEIRQIAFEYMKRGADGGGNRHGLLGTSIALCVDYVNATVKT